MNTDIFIDSSCWFAFFVPTEKKHKIVKQLIEETDIGLFTTDYIIDETLTLMQARRQFKYINKTGITLFSEEMAKIEWVQKDDILYAWKIFRSYQDKLWSFTDCVSYAVMKRLKISQAFTLDNDFHQFNFIKVAP